jgi:hypothetical protein
MLDQATRAEKIADHGLAPGSVTYSSADAGVSVEFDAIYGSALPTDAELCFNILEHVRTHEGVRISEIAEEFGLSLSHTADLVRRLRSGGYLGPAV